MARPKDTIFFSSGNPGLGDSDAAVLGVAFDGNASYGKGAALAPAAIMKASWQLDIEDPLTGRTFEKAVHNFGILKPKGARAMVRAVGKNAEKVLGKGKFFMLLGGDHSVVNGVLNAVPKETGFLNFDAHLDLREEWQGKKLSHAAVSKRIFDKGLEQSWVGTRDMINEEEMAFVEKQGLAEKIFYCPGMPGQCYKGRKFPAWMRRKNMLFNGLTAKMAGKAAASVEAEKLFLNIDVDCLDMRQGVETGVPSPFGLKLEELNRAVLEACKRKEVIGMGLCELVPDRHNRGQSFAAMLCLNALKWAMA